MMSRDPKRSGAGDSNGNRRRADARPSGRPEHADRLNLGLPSGDCDSIRRVARRASGARHEIPASEAFRGKSRRNTLGLNQKPYTPPKSQSYADTKIH